jgi:hypothetical protein
VRRGNRRDSPAMADRAAALKREVAALNHAQVQALLHGSEFARSGHGQLSLWLAREAVKRQDGCSCQWGSSLRRSLPSTSEL